MNSFDEDDQPVRRVESRRLQEVNPNNKIRANSSHAQERRPLNPSEVLNSMNRGPSNTISQATAERFLKEGPVRQNQQRMTEGNNMEETTSQHQLNQ
jgi:hypothetical protein